MSVISAACGFIACFLLGFSVGSRGWRPYDALLIISIIAFMVGVILGEMLARRRRK